MANVLLVTATPVEARAILELFPKASGAEWKREHVGNKTYYSLGNIGGVDVFMVQSEMGIGTPGGAYHTVSKGIEAYSPLAVIMVGIAFGTNPKQQKLGDILVSKQIHHYEPKKIKGKNSSPRGEKASASTHLLDKFRSGVYDWKGAPVHFGLLLSGEKLVNDLAFRNQLLDWEPEAIGGEMEGAGVYAAAYDAQIHWIVVKAICDWADGKKKDEFQITAAENAAAFTLHVIQQGGLVPQRPEKSLIPTGPLSTANDSQLKTGAAIPSTIPERYGRPFVGRETELDEMLSILGDTSRAIMLVLHGESGAGKSELAFEFARTHQSSYPGGMFLIQVASGEAAIDLASIGKNILGLHYPADLKIQDQCLQTLQKLGSAPTLLIYDNVMAIDEVQDVLPFAGSKCHVVITTTIDPWPPGWPKLPVRPFQDEVALKLVSAYGGIEVAQKYGAKVVESSGGLPIQICPLATSLRADHERGLDDAFEFTLTSAAVESYSRIYGRLDINQRLMLHTAARLNFRSINRAELLSQLQEATCMNDSQFIGVLNACMDLTLLQGRELLRMHQLLASFLVGVRIEDDLREAFARVRNDQAQRFIRLANRFSASPADVGLAAQFMAFPQSPGAWEQFAEAFSVRQNHAIGDALAELARWEEAISWYQRAIETIEKSNVHGSVDYNSLAGSLHQVGYCYTSLGKFQEALPWFRRATEAAGKGNIDGRIDHDRLGKSLNLMGDCYVSLGRFEEALSYYAPAIEIAQQGDIHGRVDYEGLGTMLHQLGYCYSSLGKFEEAILWCRRAIEATEKGDIHGRVNHASLAKSLHTVGYLYSMLGKPEEALPWLKRAVKAAEKGDMHGRIDHDSVARIHHELGHLYSILGKPDQALPWFELAIKAAEKGDIYGRVNHDSLGRALHQVGICYSKMGRFEEALSWFEHAVQATEKGDVHGRVNHNCLGASLHQGAYCYSSMGKFKEALSWLEQAVEAIEKGDIHGKVDGNGLGKILHLAGDCYLSLDKFEEAIFWYRRAIEATEKGDIHGRVDHDVLGAILHQLGSCYFRMGKLVEARLWLEQAVEAFEKGDIHGRIDHESLQVCQNALKELGSLLQQS